MIEIKRETMFHSLGMIDMMAQICMLARDKSPSDVLREVAEDLLEQRPDHPHAKWVIEKIK